MRDMTYQLKKLCRQCREGSYATQVNRERMQNLIANQLHELGYRKMPGRRRPRNQDPDPRTARDHEVRLTISRVLGHEREQITAAYLSK